MKTSFKKFNKVPLMIAILFFIVSLGIYIFLYKVIDNNNKVSEETAAEAQAETAKREEIKSLDRTLKSTIEQQALIDTHFIKAGDVVPLLDSIEKTASLVKADAQVTQVDVAPDNSSLYVGVSVTGTFESIYKFLTLMENSSYQLEIESMGLQRTSNDVEPVVQQEKVPEDTTTQSATGTDTINTPLTVPPAPVKTHKITKWSAIFRLKLLSYLKS